LVDDNHDELERTQVKPGRQLEKQTKYLDLLDGIKTVTTKKNATPRKLNKNLKIKQIK